MAGVGNEGFATDGRGREMNSVTCEFSQVAKISRQKITPQPTATHAIQKTKNCEKTIL